MLPSVPDGNTLVTGGGHTDPTVKLWDVKTGASLHILSGHTNVVNDVCFSPDGKTIATASWDKTVRIWDAATGSLIKTFNDYSDRVLSVSFSPDSKTIATAGYENTIVIWDIETGTRKNTLTIEYGQNLCVSYSPNGKTIASGGGGLKLWNASAGILRKELIPRSVINPAIFSSDGKTIASGSLRGTIYFLDVDTETVKNTISGHTRYIKSMSFSPDGKIIAIVNKDDNTFQLWDVETGTFLKTVGGDTGIDIDRQL